MPWSQALLLRGLRAADRLLLQVETTAAGLLAGFVFAVVLLQVVLRYVFPHPNPWTEELSRFGLVWLSALGASLAARARAHFLFGQLVGRLRPPQRHLVQTSAKIAVWLGLVSLVIAGAQLVVLTLPERSPALNLSMAWVYAAMPVTALFMILHLTANDGPMAGPAS